MYWKRLNLHKCSFKEMLEFEELRRSVPGARTAFLLSCGSSSMFTRCVWDHVSLVFANFSLSYSPHNLQALLGICSTEDAWNTWNRFPSKKIAVWFEYDTCGNRLGNWFYRVMCAVPAHWLKRQIEWWRQCPRNGCRDIWQRISKVSFCRGFRTAPVVACNTRYKIGFTILRWNCRLPLTARMPSENHMLACCRRLNLLKMLILKM